MSVKQDRQGARTAADIERKYNYGKKFAEMYGMITDARDSVDSLGSELRNEIVNESTAIRRDTQQIVLEATKDVVREEEFGEYKKSAEASLTVTAEAITQQVSTVEKSVTTISSDLTETKNDLTKTKNDLAATDQSLAETKDDLAETEQNLAEYWEYTQTIENSVDTKLETKEGEILASVSGNYYNKTQIDKTVGDINTGIAEVDSKVDANYTKVTDEYKKHTASELEILEKSITARVGTAEERIAGVETGVGGVESALNDYTSATDEFKRAVEEDLQDLTDGVGDANSRIDGVVSIQSQYLTDDNSEFKIMDDRITTDVGKYEEAITEVKQSITDAEGNIEANYLAYEKYVEQTDSSIDQLADKISLNFDHHEEKYTNINGEISSMETNLEKHFDFDLDGLTVRAGEGDMKLRINNDNISFYKGSINAAIPSMNRFGWWDGVNFHTGNIVIAVQERAQFGHFAFIPRSDGSLDFLKVGG